MDPETIFRRRPDVRFRRLSPEGVVVRQSDPEVLVLNDAGALILERIDGEATVGGLVDAVSGEYEVARSVAETRRVGVPRRAGGGPDHRERPP